MMNTQFLHTYKFTYYTPTLDTYTMPAENGFQLSGGAGDGDYDDFGDL